MIHFLDVMQQQALLLILRGGPGAHTSPECLENSIIMDDGSFNIEWHGQMQE
jgi:hypothetical protein